MELNGVPSYMLLFATCLGLSASKATLFAEKWSIHLAGNHGVISYRTVLVNSLNIIRHSLLQIR